MKNTNVYEMVTARVLEQMENGICPWHRPWATNGGTEFAAISHTTGTAYSLINQILLGRGGEWLTFNQIKSEGGSVKKGEKARFVVFWKMQDVVRENEETGEKEVLSQFPILRHYYVFNIDQCNGIKARHAEDAPAEVGNDKNERDKRSEEVAQEYVIREGIELHCDQYADGAYYRPSTDEIVVPMISQFESSAEYYSALFHEMTHSTGHERRLNRLSKTAAFGSNEYSTEELVAEMGSAFLCTMMGISTEEAFRNSVAYLQGWAKALRKDARMIVQAASKAEQAVKYILNEKKQ